MTVPATDSRAGPFSGTGVVVPLPFDFKVFVQEDVLVTRTDVNGLESTLVVGVDYTVTLNPDQDADPGGTVTPTVAPAVGELTTLTSGLEYEQPIDLVTGGKFRAQTVEDGFDRTTMLVKQLKEQSDRTLRLPVSSTADATLPAPSANDLIGWNATADALQNVDPISLTTIVAYGAARADLFSGDGVVTDFELTSNPGAIGNLDVAVGGVTQRPGIDYTWSGGTILHFNAAPPVGTNNVLARHMQGLPLGTSDSAASLFIQAGAGAVTRMAQDKMRESVNVRDFGAVGDGVTDDTAAFVAAVTRLNAVGGELRFEGRFLVDAGVIDLTRQGVSIIGSGKGDAAHSSPLQPAPSEIIIKGVGAGIRVRNQSATLRGFRLSSDAARAALPFDLNSPGIRLEPPDTVHGRADRCVAHDLRIDNQPGDGFLAVGQITLSSIERIDVYFCKGFGFRLDPGTLPGLTRANPVYAGLTTLASNRVGFCGGHALALSNDTVTSQTYMAVRVHVFDMDSFGNGQNTAIMYPSGDGNFYDFWVFGENCSIENSAPCGRVGQSLTPELRGGVWIAGRDNRLVNNRYIDTNQPIYWGYKSSQPSTGLEVDMFRLVNTSLTHTDAIKVQSASAKGLRVSYDRKDALVNVATGLIGTTPVSQIVEYQGTHRHLNSVFTSGPGYTVADDTALVIAFDGQGTTFVTGVLSIAATSVGSGGGIFHFRIANSSPLATKWAGEANTVAFPGGGPLTGTTGVDGQVTVSCDATRLYIENRRGFSITLGLHLAGLPTETGMVLP